MSDVIEFIPSQRGGKILIFENNMYKIKRTNKKNNTTVWYCTSGNKYGCRAKVFLNGDTFFSNSGTHNHESQEKQILNRKFMENMKDRARKDITVSVKRIYDESIAEMTDSLETPLTIPVYDSVHKTLYKARHSTTRPPVPKTVDEINLIKEKKKTKNGQEFLLKDDGYGEDRLLKKQGKNCSLVQKDDDLNLLAFENEEVITPDVEMQYSENTDMETQNDASTNLLSNSDIVIKPEIIEMELEPSVFDDSSFDSSFTDCPSETQFDGQRPSTSYEKHSESLNSDTDTLPSSEKNGASSIIPSILNEDQENSKRDNSIQPDSESSLSNEQSQLEVSSPSLHQDLNNTSHGRSCNLLKVSSPSNTPFRPRDRFDAFGEFIALKLRNLDPLSSVFVHTTIADLIFKAELGIFSNKNEKSSDTQTDDNGKVSPSVNTFENRHRSSEKENVQPKIPSHMENPHLPPDFNSTGHLSSSRNETYQNRVPYHAPNTSSPPLVSNSDSENSLRNDSILPTVTYHMENPLSPVSNATIPESTSKNSVNQNSVSSDSVGSSVSPVLNTANSLSDTPIQPFHTQPGDEFDIFGEFAALKLRNLDLRSCAYVQSAFANLIFKAELGKFVNESEQSFFINQTNDISRDMISTNDLSLQKNVSNFTSDDAHPRFNITPPLDFCGGQVPSEVKPNLHSVHK